MPLVHEKRKLVLPMLLPQANEPTLPHAVDDDTGKFTSDPQLRFKHPYPATKLMFIPDKECVHPDLIATTGDYLRIWQVKEDEVQLLKLLNNVSLRIEESPL